MTRDELTGREQDLRATHLEKKDNWHSHHLRAIYSWKTMKKKQGREGTDLRGTPTLECVERKERCKVSDHKWRRKARIGDATVLKQKRSTMYLIVLVITKSQREFRKHHWRWQPVKVSILLPKVEEEVARFYNTEVDSKWDSRSQRLNLLLGRNLWQKETALFKNEEICA